jgi:tRNA(fMet)-specific endonuclease VapC
LKNNPPKVIKNLQRHSPSTVGISVITAAELRYGASKSNLVKSNHEILDVFLDKMTVLPLEKDVAKTYGNIRAVLEKKGTPIGHLDLIIAAHALFLDATLVTNNTKEFDRVSKLKIENWVN